VEAAQQALTFVITSPLHTCDKPLPTESKLKEVLSGWLLQIQDHAALTKPLLKGLGRLLCVGRRLKQNTEIIHVHACNISSSLCRIAHTFDGG